MASPDSAAKSAAASATSAAASAQAAATALEETVNVFGLPSEAAAQKYNIENDPGVKAALSASYVGRVRPEKYGAIGDGVADDTTPTQAALTAGAAFGLPVLIEKGRTYRTTATLTAPSGLRLELEGRILGDHNSVILGNADFTSKVTVTITGHGSIGRPDKTRTGIPVKLYGDDITLASFTVSTWAGGVAMLLSGDRMRLREIRTRDTLAAVGNGGIRYVGGSNFRAYGCDVESGDDCLQFVPVANAADPFYNQNISDGRYIGCTARSTDARPLVVANADPNNVGNLTCTIQDVGFTDCDGYGGQRQLYIGNTEGGTVDGVSVIGCTLDASNGSGALTEDIQIYRSVGVLRNITLDRVRLRNAKGTTRTLLIHGTTGVTVERCDLTTTATNASVIEVSSSSSAVKIRRNTLRGSGSNAAVLVTSGMNCADVDIDQNDMLDVAAGAFAVNASTCTRPVVRRNRVVPLAGAESTAKGIRVAADCTKPRIADNDLSLLTTGVSANKVTNLATDSVIRGNVGVNPFGLLSTPAIPDTNVDHTNTLGYDATVFVTGGTVTFIRIGGQDTGVTSGSFRVPAGQAIRLTYSVAPTWRWFGD